jgi:uncharacterized membrane protein
MSAPRQRRGYLDWLRGVAVLIMIEAHLIDSWTRFPDRQTGQFAWALIVGGFGAPLFLFLAGLAVPLSAGSKLRRSGDAVAASNAVIRRGLEIFGLAFLFRIQAWILGWSSPRSLLRVDILNIMGPSIAIAGVLWRTASTSRGHYVLFAGATLATTLLTPLIRYWGFIGQIPDPMEAYLRPVGDLSNFTFFPWAGFLFAGAFVGVALDDARSEEVERRANLWLGAAGVALALVAYRLSFFPTWYPQSRFWTSSPSFFFIRLGILTAAIAVAYAWDRRPGAAAKWSPLQQLGRTSLFIYWIHVELVYGLISLSWHKNLSLNQAWVSLVIFWVFMLACSIAKDRVVEWWNQRPGRPAPMGFASSLPPSSGG